MTHVDLLNSFDALRQQIDKTLNFMRAYESRAVEMTNICEALEKRKALAELGIADAEAKKTAAIESATKDVEKIHKLADDKLKIADAKLTDSNGRVSELARKEQELLRKDAELKALGEKLAVDRAAVDAKIKKLSELSGLL